MMIAGFDPIVGPNARVLVLGSVLGHAVPPGAAHELG
jgi:hypothetical protein